MKEYGGYIELETNFGKEYYDNLIKLNCGRACLAYLIETRKIKKLFLPFYICNAVRQVCDSYGIKYESYFIDERFQPIIPEGLYQESEETYFYVVNYYGQLGRERLLNLKEKYENLIIDNVCAFFDEPIYGCDTIYSCRKYFGVTDGAYLSSNIRRQMEYPIDISYDRMQFLLGRFEGTASDFYEAYIKNNKSFVNEPIKRMSKLTSNLLKGIDYEIVKERRKRNFQYLHMRLGEINQLALAVPVGPYAYPLWIKEGHRLRRQLQKNKIYIPILWPEVLELVSESTLEYNLVNDVLPLPIDQRYDEKDMEYICSMIEKAIVY